MEGSALRGEDFISVFKSYIYIYIYIFAQIQVAEKLAEQQKEEIAKDENEEEEEAFKGRTTPFAYLLEGLSAGSSGEKGAGSGGSGADSDGSGACSNTHGDGDGDSDGDVCVQDVSKTCTLRSVLRRGLTMGEETV